jgi:hypothetical protein
MRLLGLLGLVGALLGGTLGGCAAANVAVFCDGGTCMPSDVGCEGDDCFVCPDPFACNAEGLCSEMLCDGLSFICGQTGSGQYAWTTTMANCDDGDPCTDNDHCLGSMCAGTPKACTTPFPAECLNSSTLRTYMPPGDCVDGMCDFPYVDRPCPANDCQGGTCSGDPCAGVTCPPSDDPCLEEVGTCVNGQCTYAPKVLDCSRPHATGGHCVDGNCDGWTCDSGYDNCNGDWLDGCEISLKSNQHCGACDTPCTVAAGLNAGASCSTGTCVLTCTGSWQNCDDDWGNGCEILVGVAAQCDTTGLNATSGCGTAHCGTSSDTTNATNFGTWYCKFCSTCHHFTDGYSWCLWPAHSGGVGQWSAERCLDCCSSGSRDLTCGP